MGSKKWVEHHFSQRFRTERERRGWSQSELADRLTDSGVPVHATTVAKIEKGTRSVRIDEAVGIADLFEVSVDTLLGRGRQNDLGYLLRMTVDAATQGRQQVEVIANGLGDRIDDVKALEFDNRDDLVVRGQRALDRLHDAAQALGQVAGFSLPSELVIRRPEDVYFADYYPNTSEASREASRQLFRSVDQGADERPEETQ